jgi:hypothetical protein
MSRNAARHAGNPENSAREIATPHGKCTLRPVPSVAQRLKYLLSHVRVGLFTAAIVLTRQKQPKIKSQVNSPLSPSIIALRRRAFFKKKSLARINLFNIPDVFILENHEFY